MELKRIAVSIRSDQLEEVENRLKGPDVLGISVDYIKGYGESATSPMRERIQHRRRSQ